MNYDEIIKIIKRKTDKLLELTDPENPMHELAATIEGKYSSGKLLLFEPENWTHSFFNGIIAYMYYHYKDKKYLDYLIKQKKNYTDLLYNNDNEISHDVGFLYSLYAVAVYKLTGDNSFKKLALKAADEIGKRYQFRANVVQAFYDMRVRGVTDDIALIIVDDMMNMQLLMWAYKETGHSFYRSVYENHIGNSVKYLIRDDYSVRHAYHFDAKTGSPINEMNYCGYAVGSHWARGTAWMIYGLIGALIHTGHYERYFYPLMGVCEKFSSLLRSDFMPVWDFRLPKSEIPIIDTSAAVIAASAFKEFEYLNIDNSIKDKYMTLADDILNSLCKNYLSTEKEESIISQGQTGKFSAGVIWGDYFFTELVMKSVYGKDTPNFWL